MDLQPPPFNISQLIELQYAPDTCYCAFNMPYVTANINLLLHLHFAKLHPGSRLQDNKFA
jgi:hypothetical protein